MSTRVVRLVSLIWFAGLAGCGATKPGEPMPPPATGGAAPQGGAGGGPAGTGGVSGDAGGSPGSGGAPGGTGGVPGSGGAPPGSGGTPGASLGQIDMGLWNVVAGTWVAGTTTGATAEVKRVELPPLFTVGAATPETLPAGMGSIAFDVNGKRVSVDDVEPYFLNSAADGKPTAWAPGFGTFEVKATRYSGLGGMGTILATATKTFKILADGMDPAFKPLPATENQAWIAANIERVMVKGTFMAGNGQSMPYRLFTPPHRADGVKYPLFVYLNGYGERGNTNPPALYGTQLFRGPQGLVSPNLQAEFPCFIVIPQGSTADEFWAWVGGDPALEKAKNTGGVMQAPTISKSGAAGLELIDSLIKMHNLDKRRIYIGGLSTGGSGSLEWPQRRPDLFAAALPMAPWADWSKAGVAKETAFWFFHSDKDTDTPVGNSITMVKEMEKANVPHVRFSHYPNHDHVATMNRGAALEPDLWSWTFAWIR